MRVLFSEFYISRDLDEKLETYIFIYAPTKILKDLAQKFIVTKKKKKMKCTHYFNISMNYSSCRYYTIKRIFFDENCQESTMQLNWRSIIE